MKKNIFLSLILVAISATSFYCTKEGPAGPAGATGATGPAGPTGSTGQQGPTGTANVIYSPWFLTGTGWTATGANVYGAVFLFDKAAPGVTQTIMDQGIVLGYLKGEPNTPSIGSQIFSLPYGVGVGFGFFDQYELMLNTPGNVRFLYKSDSPWTAAQISTISFRYIIIPGGVAGGRMRDPRTMTYHEVCQAYGIPE